MKKIYYLLLSSMLCMGVSSSLKAQVDLSIGNIDAGFEYNSSTGVIRDIYFTVLSNENSGATFFKIGMYFVPVGATSMDEAILIDETEMNSISGNSSREVTDWTIDVNEAMNVPPDGDYRLLVYVDYKKTISETDETNNSLFISEQGNNLTFRKKGGSTGLSAAHPDVNAFGIYPNPSASTATISFETPEATPGSVRVTDVTGKEIAVIAAGSFSGSNEVALNAAAFAPGVYYIVLETKAGRSTRKFIRQ